MLDVKVWEILRENKVRIKRSGEHKYKITKGRKSIGTIEKIGKKHLYRYTTRQGNYDFSYPFSSAIKQLLLLVEEEQEQGFLEYLEEAEDGNI